MEEKYDSTADTLKHIKRVAQLLGNVNKNLIDRAANHDSTKLEDPEKALFDEYTPKLKHCTYGSDEYNDYLKKLKVALDHHYAKFRHHPEYFSNGIKDMNLIDLLEMIIDWKAASERHTDGDIFKSIDINQPRFGYSDETAGFMKNTIIYMRNNWML